MSTKSKKKETSLFSSHDHTYHLSDDESNEKKLDEFDYSDGQYPYINNNWIGQPQLIWDPSMQQISYNQYPPAVYYPYDYQTVQPVQSQMSLTSAKSPTIVSKTPANKPSASLPRAPFGRTPRETTIVPSALGVAQPSIIPIPTQQTVVSPIATVQYSQPPLPPPPPPPPPPPAPIYYYPDSPPSPHYYRRSICSPFYYSRYPPPPHYYERPNLPPIPRRESRREYEYYDRYYHDDPYVITYSGRHYDSDRYRRPHRWYD